MSKFHINLTFCCILSLYLLVSNGAAKLKEGECEVCIGVLNKFIESVDKDVSPGAIEEQFIEYCKLLKGKEERFCYYLGGLETSATGILSVMSKPLSYSMPTEKVCEKLKAYDMQICELKYEKQIDLSKVNLKKLKVKDLRKILSDWGEDNACKGCVEKPEFIRAVEELMPKYAPEAFKVRKEEL